MRRLRSDWGLAAGLGLILLTNAVILTRVAWNRSGEPDAVLELTDRELRVRRPWTKENTGLSLQLVWPRAPVRGSEAGGVNPDPCHSPEWLDLEKLAELGFDVALPPTDAEHRRFHSKAPGRLVTLVLTVGGEEWRRWADSFDLETEEVGAEEGQASAPPRSPEAQAYWESIERALRQGSRSRLWLVDAGTDPEALRELYPDRDRYALVPGLVGMFLHQPRDQPPRLEGVVLQLLREGIHVPLQFRPVLEEALRGKRAFRAKLAFGKRSEPWLLSVEGPESAGADTGEEQDAEDQTYGCAVPAGTSRRIAIADPFRGLLAEASVLLLLPGLPRRAAEPPEKPKECGARYGLQSEVSS